MRCPRCSIEGEWVNGACPHCGYRRTNVSGSLRNASLTGARPVSSPLRSPSGNLPSAHVGGARPTSGPLRSPSVPLRTLSAPLRTPSTPLAPLSNPSRSLSLYTARRGDILNQGRYHLIEPLVLPDNQQGQGAAWLVMDTLAGQAQVVLREVVLSPSEQLNRQQSLRTIAMRFSEASQHPGFPKVLDVFQERGKDFIVLQHIKGESLASLLKRQGGALPERTVAEYGRQLCEMLKVLSSQQPPVVHGAISPEIVVVGPDRTSVHLLHLPLSPPKELVNIDAVVGYKAPEQMHGIIDASSDLYSVAATMHHAVTGFDPHERVAFFYPLVRRLNPDISPQMETILSQELRLSPSQRYLNSEDMQKDLSALLSSPTATENEKRLGRAVSTSLQMDISDVRNQSRRRSVRHLSLFAGICLVILLFVVFFAGIYPLLQASNADSLRLANATATAAALSNALKREWQAEASTYQKNHVAISDGRYIFDAYPGGHVSDALSYKMQAAQALLNNDLNTAFSDYQKAVTLDSKDGEAQIYYQDLRLETQNTSYITIILGLPLNSDARSLSLARSDLQSAFVFQNLVNTQNLLPNGLKLRILIGNSGGQDSDATTIAQFIAKRVQIGNLEHIVAVVGWPITGGSRNASAVLAAAKIPMVSQTASGTVLDNLNSYFFRVNPNDSVQGQEQAKFAYEQLDARKVLVLRDPADSYSKSLADAFINSFQRLGGTPIDNSDDYFTQDTTTVEQYEQNAIQDALHNQVDMIFLPGHDEDAVRLAHALGVYANFHPYLLGKVKILGGDAINTSLLLGNGDSSDATLAQNNPQQMRHLYFTSFSDVSEWSDVTQDQQPAFFSAWARAYGGGVSANAPVLTNNVLMTDDAFGVILYAIKLVNKPLTGINLRDALASIGTGHISPYKGISGPIAFGLDGNPINKPLVLLSVVYDDASGANVIDLVQTSGPIH
jgi:ABC-type branched-subunit amino acid transport system substrate-binding protein/serine/threonine protein kinase